MIKASAKEVRQHFSHFINQAENGEEVIIFKRGIAVAHIIPHSPIAKKSLPSLKEFRSKIKVAGKPLSEMIAEARTEE